LLLEYLVQAGATSVELRRHAQGIPTDYACPVKLAKPHGPKRGRIQHDVQRSGESSPIANRRRDED
jgi:hypothetical protein